MSSAQQRLLHGPHWEMWGAMARERDAALADADRLIAKELAGAYERRIMAEYFDQTERRIVPVALVLTAFALVAVFTAQ